MHSFRKIRQQLKQGCHHSWKVLELNEGPGKS